MRFLAALAAWVVFLALAGCGTEVPPSEKTVNDIFPADGFLGTWNRVGKHLVFKGANLYGHIDGGAEIFLELGFDRLEVQRYARGEEEEVSVEVYRMDDPAAALGIYLMKCGLEATVSSFDERHTASKYQILFQKGSTYVTLYNMTGEEEPGSALLDFAKALAKKIPAGEAIDPFASLPANKRIEGSERIIRGPFTLQRVFTLGKGDILLLENNATAVAASYGDGDGESFTLILVDYPDAAAAVSAFRNVKANLDPYLEVISSDDSALEFKDYSSRFGKVEVNDSRLELLVNLAESP